MADMAETVTYRLSSLDQSIIRTYIRYCLCYPLNGGEEASSGPADSEQASDEHESNEQTTDEKAIREQVIANLATSIKRTISYMPVLAGKVYSVEDNDDGNSNRRDSFESVNGVKQRGRVEARVTLAQVNGFQPTIKFLSSDDFPHTYEDLSASEMPADAFIGNALTPLPDMATSNDDGAPVFAVQANFIEGGVLVCLYLHHSVADLKGLVAVARHMSSTKESPPGIRHTLQSLKDNATENSRMRDRLSGSRDAKANLKEHPEYDVAVRHPLAPSQGTSRVLAISLEMLDGTRDMINERFQYTIDEPGVHLSAFDCLAGVLWKAITRARWPPGSALAGKRSRILIPADMSKRMEPPLPEQFYGNSCLFSHAECELVKLTAPYDIGSLAITAHGIRKGIYSMDDAKARSAIAIINECEEVTELNHPNIDFSKDVFITNWASMTIDQEATLGLGLGPPEWARKVSRGQSACGCVLLPLKKEEGVWEVMVSLTDDAMERLVDDPGLAPFILSVA